MADYRPFTLQFATLVVDIELLSCRRSRLSKLVSRLQTAIGHCLDYITANILWSNFSNHTDNILAALSTSTATRCHSWTVAARKNLKLSVKLTRDLACIYVI